MQIFQIRGQAQKGKAVHHHTADQFEHRGLLKVWRAPFPSENGMDAMLEARCDSWCRKCIEYKCSLGVCCWMSWVDAVNFHECGSWRHVFLHRALHKRVRWLPMNQ